MEYAQFEPGPANLSLHVCLFTHRSRIAERVGRFLAVYSPIPSSVSSSSRSSWVSSSSAVSTSRVSSTARLP